MYNGKEFPSLDGMVSSNPWHDRCLSFYQSTGKPKRIGFLETNLLEKKILIPAAIHSSDPRPLLKGGSKF